MVATAGKRHPEASSLDGNVGSEENALPRCEYAFYSTETLNLAPACVAHELNVTTYSWNNYFSLLLALGQHTELHSFVIRSVVAPL